MDDGIVIFQSFYGIICFQADSVGSLVPSSANDWFFYESWMRTTFKYWTSYRILMIFRDNSASDRLGGCGSIPGRGRGFPFAITSRQSLGPIQPPTHWVSGIKWPERESIHLHPSSAEIKNAWSYTSTPPYVFMAWYLISKGTSYLVKSIQI